MQYQARTFSIPAIDGISQKQIDAHLKLYEGYVKQTNTLLSELSRLSSDTANAYLVGELRKRLGFEWNGMRLHELYFEQLEGGTNSMNADTALFSLLARQFGSYEAWYEAFTHLSGRGPGWSLLDFDPVTKQFHHVWVEDHHIGHLAGTKVIFALDHWEHAYLLDYTPAEKQKYLDAYFSHVNWEIVSKRFDTLQA